MDTEKIDKGTDIISVALNLLLTRHPERTALGAVVGYVLFELTKTAKTIFNTYILPYGIDITQMSWLGYVLIGIVIFHSHTIYKLVFFGHSPLTEEVDQIFAAIDRVKDELHPIQRQELYLQACERVLEKVVLDQKTEKELQNLLQLARQGDDSLR